MTIKNRQSSIVNHQSRGFTLIELLVVIVMISIFLLMTFLIIDPIGQLDKVKDAQRKRDLEQVKRALDVYYNDNNCYPTKLQSIPFGLEWKDSGSGVVYMKKVPQDPDCSRTGYCFVYQTDATGCPQWNVLYTRLSRPTNSLTSCLMFQACGYLQVKYNYCVMSGNADCAYIKSNPLPAPVIPTSGPTSAPTGGPTSPPTPTPTQAPGGNCSPNYFAVSSGLCNSVTSNNCSIYGGSLTCYSGPSAGDPTKCTGFLCTQ